MSAVFPIIRGIVLVTALLSISACNELAGLLGKSTTSIENRIKIVGAGVKGPLAFARVSLYKLDTTQASYYDPGKPITTSTSNAYAAIDDLSISSNVNVPLVMVIDADNAIDLTTGSTPVITRLITVITQGVLYSGKPVYATPLTTLAFHMAMHGAGANASTTKFLNELATNAEVLKKSLGFGTFPDFDIFSTPPVINNNTRNLQQQQLVARHRAAVEALSAMIHEMAQPAADGSTKFNSNELLRDLAVDLQSDGIIDNADSGITIGTIDPAIMSKDPLNMLIPNSILRVRQIAEVLDSDLAYLPTTTLYQKSQINIKLPRVRLDSNMTSSKIVLHWNPNTDQILGYRVYYGAAPSTATTEISDIPMSSPGLDPLAPAITFDSWDDLGAQTGDNLCFSVRAYNADGLSGFSNAVCSTVR